VPATSVPLRRGVLCVTVTKGVDLRSVEKLGRQDPYVVVDLECDGVRVGTGKTGTVWKGGRNPVWTPEVGNTVEVEFEVGASTAVVIGGGGGSDGDGGVWTLKVHAWDDERAGSPVWIGSGQVDVRSTVVGGVAASGVLVGLADKASKGAGSVEVSLTSRAVPSADASRLPSPAVGSGPTALEPRRGLLNVRVVRGVDLRNTEKLGRQDPFVTASLDRGGAVTSKGKSCTVWKGGRNPVWPSDTGNSIGLDYVLTSVSAPAVAGEWQLHLEVWDDERFGDPVFIGAGTLEVSPIVNKLEWVSDAVEYTVKLTCSGKQGQPVVDAGALVVVLSSRQLPWFALGEGTGGSDSGGSPGPRGFHPGSGSDSDACTDDEDGNDDSSDNADGFGAPVHGTVCFSLLDADLEGVATSQHDVSLSVVLLNGSGEVVAEAEATLVSSESSASAVDASLAVLRYNDVVNVEDFTLEAEVWVCHVRTQARRLVGKCDVDAVEFLGRVLRAEEQEWDVVCETPYRLCGTITVSATADCSRSSSGGGSGSTVAGSSEGPAPTRRRVSPTPEVNGSGGGGGAVSPGGGGGAGGGEGTAAVGAAKRRATFAGGTVRFAAPPTGSGVGAGSGSGGPARDVFEGSFASASAAASGRKASLPLLPRPLTGAAGLAARTGAVRSTSVVSSMGAGLSLRRGLVRAMRSDGTVLLAVSNVYVPGLDLSHDPDAVVTAKLEDGNGVTLSSHSLSVAAVYEHSARMASASALAPAAATATAAAAAGARSPGSSNGDVDADGGSEGQTVPAAPIDDDAALAPRAPAGGAPNVLKLQYGNLVADAPLSVTLSVVARASGVGPETVWSVVHDVRHLVGATTDPEPLELPLYSASTAASPDPGAISVLVSSDHRFSITSGDVSDGAGTPIPGGGEGGTGTLPPALCVEMVCDSGAGAVLDFRQRVDVVMSLVNDAGVRVSSARHSVPVMTTFHASGGTLWTLVLPAGAAVGAAGGGLGSRPRSTIAVEVFDRDVHVGPIAVADVTVPGPLLEYSPDAWMWRAPCAVATTLRRSVPIDSTHPADLARSATLLLTLSQGVVGGAKALAAATTPGGSRTSRASQPVAVSSRSRVNTVAPAVSGDLVVVLHGLRMSSKAPPAPEWMTHVLSPGPAPWPGPGLGRGSSGSSRSTDPWQGAVYATLALVDTHGGFVSTTCTHAFRASEGGVGTGGDDAGSLALATVQLPFKDVVVTGGMRVVLELHRDVAQDRAGEPDAHGGDVASGGLTHVGSLVAIGDVDVCDVLGRVRAVRRCCRVRRRFGVR
jgi:hypothetical protein